MTLPLILLRDAELSSLEMVQTVLRAGKYATVSQQDLREARVRTGALQKARDRADEYAESARSVLDNLPESEYSDSLRSLPAYILDRDR